MYLSFEKLGMIVTLRNSDWGAMRGDCRFVLFEIYFISVGALVAGDSYMGTTSVVIQFREMTWRTGNGWCLEGRKLFAISATLSRPKLDCNDLLFSLIEFFNKIINKKSLFYSN